MTPIAAMTMLNVVSSTGHANVSAMKASKVTAKLVKSYTEIVKMSMMPVIHKMAFIQSHHMVGLVHRLVCTAKWMTAEVGR